MTQTTTQLDPYVRWAIRRDLEQILLIENRCFAKPWPLDEFLMWLKNRNTVGIVADLNGLVAGYMVFIFDGDHLLLANFAVDPAFRRQGIGSRMIDKLKNKLSPSRPRIIAEVRETNTAMHLFLRSQGFKCVKVVRDAYDDDSGDSAYRFEFCL